MTKSRRRAEPSGAFLNCRCAIEADWRKRADGIAQGILPLSPDRLEIRILRIEQAMAGHFERVPRIDQKIDRRSDSGVRAHGRIERNQRVFRAFFQRRVTIAYASIEYRTTILR